jgi:hypothetical protein
MYLDVSYFEDRSSPLDMPQCPRCGDDFVRRRTQGKTMELIITRLGVFPFHCQRCSLQFWSRSSGIQSKRAERRRHARVPVSVQSSFQGSELAGRGRVVDLSIKGCGIESEVEVQPNSVMSLSLHVYANHAPITVRRGLVQYREGLRFGTEFLQMDSEQKDRLRVYLKCLVLGGQHRNGNNWQGQECNRREFPESDS